MDLSWKEVAKRDLYRKLHMTYISEKLGYNDLLFRWWCGGNKRFVIELSASKLCKVFHGEISFLSRNSVHGVGAKLLT
jgi:hypothetical protein